MCCTFIMQVSRLKTAFICTPCAYSTNVMNVGENDYIN